MPLTPAQNTDVTAILTLLLTTTNQRKRRLSEVFLELVDKVAYPEYYEVIPEPRCLNGIKRNLQGGKYNDPLDAYEDLNLVFLNAMYYNEESSTISKDAKTLKTMLDREWKARSNLPKPRSSPPPTSAQKHHALATATATATATPSTAATSLSQQQGQSSPADQGDTADDMEVDIGGTPEPDPMPQETIRDADSDEIVKRVERLASRWDGLADVGWAEHLTPEKQIDVVRAIVEYQDASGLRLATALEALPEETNKPEIPFVTPLSLSIIENKASKHGYISSEAFDKDMANLFLKARRTHEPVSVPYGHVLTLQRLYQALTSPTPPSGPPYISSTHFSPLAAGPGRVKPLKAPDADGVAGVTAFRIPTRDRTFVDEVKYKGWSVKLADWVHLMNPDDASRPIVAQVCKCWVSDEISKKGQQGVTVCWYYRPEQTFHPSTRQFWEHETFKTGHFADHLVADLIEKITVQFTTRHVRGRPKAPFWYPGWPLYVCDSRYNDGERTFVRIKNWASCVPEEVRKDSGWMAIEGFEKMVWPRRVGSPFVVAQGERVGLGDVPGGIDESVGGDGEKVETGVGPGRRRPKRNAASSTPVPTAVAAVSGSGTKTGDTTGRYAPTQAQAQPVAPYPSQNQTQTQTQAAAQVQYAYAQQQQQQQAQQPQPQYMMQHRIQDRSLTTGAGLTAYTSSMVTERLPPETTQFFQRDPMTNEVLWFAAPPVDMPRSTVPKYSLAYLHHLAKKRKRPEFDSMDVDVNEHEGDNNDGGMQNGNGKRRPENGGIVGMTATERLASVMRDYPRV